MKIEIEKSLQKIDVGTTREFNTIIHIVKDLKPKTISELSKILSNQQFLSFEWGCGSSHVWVKEVSFVYDKWYHLRGRVEVNKDRLMIITE